MQDKPRRFDWRHLIATAIAVLAAGVTIGISVDDGSVTVRVGTTVHKDPQPTPAEKTLDVIPPKGEFDAPPPNDARGVPDNPTAEPPAKVADQQQAKIDDQAYDTSRVLEGAAAEPANFICYTPMNGGSRSYSDIGLMVAHVTVSLNVAGYADGNGLCAFFRNVKASPNWTVDNEGNSWENVPLNRVPWTNAWFNRASCTIEYIGSTGRPGEGPAQWTDIQLREGGRLFAKCAKLAHIPVRNGRVNGDTGVIYTTGLITHQELGAKGGGHSDPGPFWNRERQLFWIRHYLHPCDTRCHRVKELRAKHQSTHERFAKLDCRHKHKPENGYCRRLRNRNEAVHRAVRDYNRRHPRHPISLKGTYR